MFKNRKFKVVKMPFLKLISRYGACSIEILTDVSVCIKIHKFIINVCMKIHGAHNSQGILEKQ